MSGQLRNKLREQLDEQWYWQYWRLRRQLDGQLHRQLYGQLCWQLYGQLYWQLYEQLRNEFREEEL